MDTGHGGIADRHPALLLSVWFATCLGFVGNLWLFGMYVALFLMLRYVPAGWEGSGQEGKLREVCSEVRAPASTRAVTTVSACGPGARGPRGVVPGV